MASFETENYSFKTYTEDGLEVVALIDLLTDRSVSAYLNDIDVRLMQPEESDLLNNAYLVKTKEDRIIGYVNLFKRDNTLEQHYAILKNERGKGYAKSIVLELSQEVFKRRSDIDEILLKIHVNNIESKRVALSTGFKKKELDGEYNIFAKTRK